MMTTKRTVLAAIAFILTGTVAGQAGQPSVPSVERNVLPVHNCHRQPAMGFVPEYGRDLYHSHDANCAAAIMNGGQADGQSRAPVQRQRQPQQQRVEPKSEPRFKPQPQRPEQRYADCHRNVQVHRVPGFNRPVAHRHVGPNCRIEVYERLREPQEALPQRPLRPGGPCVQRGSVRYCEGL